MERISRVRAIILLVIFFVILLLFSVRLFDLQIIETQGNTDNTTVYTTKTRVKASRGDLLDRNGNVLVGNRASYDLVFNHYVIKSADNTNEHLYKLIKMCKELELDYADHFPVTPTRPFEYTLTEYTTAWQGYFQKFLGPNWCDLDSDITAPLLIQKLREIYKIPAEWTDEEARAVIGLRYEFDLRGVAPLSNYILLEDVDDDDLAQILELNIPGLDVESSTVREYHTTYAAHILGTMGAMNPDQWAALKDTGEYYMDAQIGQSGFESAFEEYLHGIDGMRIDKVDKDGTLISQEYAEGEEPRAGNNVELTVDINLQMVAEDALADTIEYLRDPERNSGDGLETEGGSVVVMNMTGEVLALASYPTYDLATYNENFKELSEAEYDPLYNRALMGTYYSGSVFKMCTLIAAMNNGVYTAGDTITTKGIYMKYDYANFTPKCTAYNSRVGAGSHGTIDATKAIEVSCNYFFYELGDRLWYAGETLEETAKALGLGEKTGVELNEATGYRAGPEASAALHKGLDTDYSVGDQIQAAIGQSDNMFTPMQLCVYATTLANKGIRYKATFLSRVVSADYISLVLENEPEILSQLNISDETYNTYITGMKNVVKGSQGTARRSMASLDVDVEVCAKTGTSQTGRGKDDGTFLCFAPATNPEIAIFVHGEKAEHGSTLAQVAIPILEEYFGTDEISYTITYENQVG